MKEYARKRQPKRDLTKSAEPFGSWTAVEWLGYSKTDRDHYYRCRCACGVEREIPGKNLFRRLSKSCGCQKGSLIRGHRWKGHGKISGSYWYAVKKDAAKRNHAFKITIEYAWELLRSQEFRCAFTKLELTTEGDYGRGTASLDRKDSKLGYIPGNVHWVHRDVNLMKNTLTITRFVELCRLVTEHGAFDVSTSDIGHDVRLASSRRSVEEGEHSQGGLVFRPSPDLPVLSRP